MNKRAARTAIGIAVSIGWASMLAFLAFLVIGPVSPLDFSFSQRGLLRLDAGLSLVFFIQHSVMIRKSFRTWITRPVSPEYFGVLYTVASGVALLALVAFWQESDVIIASAHGAVRWALRAVPVLSIAGFVWGVRSLRFFDPFGTSPITNRMRGREPRPMPLVAAGPYRWVRHPLYFFIVLMVWAYPDLTADRLLFNVLWTAWIVIASLLEERDLVGEFGDSYRRYQKQVPMLIPYRIPSNVKGN